MLGRSEEVRIDSGAHLPRYNNVEKLNNSPE